MAAEETNPFFASLDVEEGGGAATVPISFMNKMQALWAAKATQPTVVVAPPAPVVTTKGWSCRALIVFVLVAVIVTLVGALVWASVYGGYANLESTGNTITSFLTRYSAIQNHHPILAHFDTYGDEPSASDLRLETTSLKSFARIAGSVDLASMRFDWNLRVNDAHSLLGSRMTVALWVQRYDVATHLMRHVAHSPLVLCANVTTSGPCVGHLDRPPAELSLSEELDPRLLSLALYDASRVRQVNQTSVPLWIVPV